MQNADAVRYPGPGPGRSPLAVSHASVINAANDLASTNSTSSRFIGTNQRSWMTSGIAAVPGITPPGHNGLISTKSPKSSSARQMPTSRNANTTQATTSNLGVTIPSTSTAASDAPAPQQSPSSPTRPSPSYRVLSPTPVRPPENAGHTYPNRDEQAGGASAPGLRPASVNEQVPEERGDTSNLAAEAEAAESTTTSGHGVEVVDLTASQPDQDERAPQEHQMDMGLSLLSTQEHAAEIEINAPVAPDTTRPPIARPVISPDESELWQPRTDSDSNSTVIPTSAPAQDIFAPSNGARRSASTSVLAGGQAAAVATHSRPLPAQSLNSAASPLTQHHDQLQRKRPSIDSLNPQHPQARLRVESPRTPPLTHHFAPSTTSSQLPPQDQVIQHQPNPFVPPVQAIHQQNIPPQSQSTAPVQSQHLVHGRATSRAGLHQVAPQPQQQPHRTHNAQPSITVPGRGQSYLAGFDTTIAEMGARINLSDRPQLRIPWIRDACQNNDLFFLLLNQLLCTWHCNKELLVQLGLDGSCDGGFRTLELLFASNTELPDELVAFLAGWPNSSYSLKANAELNQWVANIGLFLPQLSMHWDGFRQHCINRRCPPTAREITDVFRCPPSTVLPRAIFTSLARQVEPGAPPEFQSAAYELFRMNQNNYFTALFQHHVNCSLEADYGAFSIQYGHLLEQYWRRAAGTIAPSPGQPSLSTSSAATSRPLQSRLTLPSQRELPNAPTAYRDVPSLNQDLINSIAASGTGPTQANSFPPPASTPGFHSSINTGTRTLNGRAHASPAAHSPMNTMGPIQSSFARTNFQPPSNVASPAPAIPHSPAINSQPSRTQIFRPTPPYRPVQLLPPDLSHLPPLLTNPLPEQEALHLAHLRQPHSEVKDTKPGEQPRLYQFIQSCTWGPYPFEPEIAFFEVSFELSPDLVRRKADIIEPPVASFKLPKRVFTTDSLLFNLRCVLLQPGEELLDESNWAALPTCYPQHVFISLNNEHLEIRRKRQFRKDLPIDVTLFVRAGKNTIKVSVHGEMGEEGKKFAIAVEVIGLRDHSQAFKMPTKISIQDSLRSITSTMQTAADRNDDDMQVVNDIVLSITDPFLSSMFTVPVRGKNCRHQECFDLETFLRSRVSDNKDALTSVYEWRCPTCSKDARPSSLVIDGFLQEVRDQLIEANNTEARAIIVREDGSWAVKQRVDSERGRTASGTEPGQNGQRAVNTDQATVTPHVQLKTAADSVNAQNAPSKIIEIIDLDED